MAKSNNIEKLSGYELMRKWFDFAFENQDKVCPSHTAMFSWFVELNNRMGWAEKFSSPASQTMAAIGLKSYNSYKRIFDDLVIFRFVKVVAESKNQWTACIIALSNNNNATDKASNKALDKALTKHTTKQSESTRQSTGESIDSINKPLNYKPLNQETKDIEEKKSEMDFEYICLEESTQWQEALMRKHKIQSVEEIREWIKEFFLTLKSEGLVKTDMEDVRSHCSRWIGVELKKTVGTGSGSAKTKFEKLQQTFNNTGNPYANGNPII